MKWQTQTQIFSILKIIQTNTRGENCFYCKVSPWWLRRLRVRLQVQETQVRSLVGKIPWRREWQPTPESQGQRSLAGYSPWGRKELDPAERLHFLSFIVRLRKRHKLTRHDNLKETETFILANLKLTLQSPGEKVLCTGKQGQTKQDNELTGAK